METTNPLNRAVYGKPAGKDTPPGALGYSANLTPDKIEAWRQWVTLDPMPLEASTDARGQAFGLFDGANGDYLLARVQMLEHDPDNPIYEFILLKRRDLQAVSGNLRLLLDLVDEPLPVFADYNTPLEPAYLAPTTTWTLEKRLGTLNQLPGDVSDGWIERVLPLLGAAISERGLLVHGFNDSYERRVEFVQGLMMLLPSTSRPDLTFTTHTRTPQRARTQIVFTSGSDLPDTGGRWVADFTQNTFPALADMNSIYLNCLHHVWNGDLKAFVSELRSMELLTTRRTEGGLTINSLDEIGERFLQDRQALAGEPVPVEAVFVALADDKVTGELRHAYLRLLLTHALDTRDTQAVTVVTRAMDADAPTEQALENTLELALKTYPDAVYVLARERLRQGIDARWVARLQLAAVAALDIAIREADAGTLINWLRLVAREPDNYALDDILQKALMDSRARGYQEGDIGYTLIVIAAKHAPQLLTYLLDDPQLIDALPPTPRAALRDYTPDAIAEVVHQGRELFLAVMGRAVRERSQAVSAPEFLTELWAIYITTPEIKLPSAYQPQTIIDTLIYDGVTWLTDTARHTLLTLMITDGYDDLFLSLLRRIETIDEYLLGSAISYSNRAPEAVIGVMGQAVMEETLTLQQAVNLYGYLLDAHDWSPEYRILAEQIARHFQQSPSLSLPSAALKRLLDVACDTRSESIARALLKRLLGELERPDDDGQTIKQFIALWEKLKWSVASQAQLLVWWRDYVRGQPLARLQTFDKGLDGKKSLEDARSIVQTTIALRRMLGKRSLEDFADAVANAYSMLQALSDAFDPISKQAPDFDPETARAELENRQSELTPDEKKVLAKNLRELSGIIALMAEHRSKASLIRREGEVERQLISGGQLPHSAIDMMRWLSGYLDGAHHSEQ